jgi:hypothetical protein
MTMLLAGGERRRPGVSKAEKANVAAPRGADSRGAASLLRPVSPLPQSGRPDPEFRDKVDRRVPIELS